MHTTSRTPRLEHVLVSEAMHARVFSCTPDTPLHRAAEQMASAHVHCLVVEGSGSVAGEGWSVLSDRDLVAAAAARRGLECSAGQVAGTEAPRIAADDSLLRATQMMTEHDVSHLLVVGAENGRPVGVLSTLDVAAVLALP